MIIGTVKELLDNEARVGLTPKQIKELVKKSHEVIVETNAGLGAGILDDDYLKAGALVLAEAEDIWQKANLIVKVKAPIQAEFKHLREGLTIFCYLHLAAHKDLVLEMIDKKVTGVAFETIETKNHELLALKPMSAVAGRLAVMIGSDYLRKSKGGSGVLITGLVGTNNTYVSVIGAGNVGLNALEVLVGFNTKIAVVDINENKLNHLSLKYGDRIETYLANDENLKKTITQSDLVIGSVSIPGASAPKLIKRSYYKDMKQGSVIIDVAIDQGGSTEVSRPTSHKDPVFVVDGITHYCVPNIPGDVPMTSTEALCDAVFPYLTLIADEGVEIAAKTSSEIRKGLNIYQGKVVNKRVADSLDLNYHEIFESN